MSQVERNELANKIRIGIPFNRILEDIRDAVALEKSISRFHIVNKRDLHNIVREYDLDKDIVHKNGAFSVKTWVEEQMALNENSWYFISKCKMKKMEDHCLNKTLC